MFGGTAEGRFRVVTRDGFTRETHVFDKLTHAGLGDTTTTKEQRRIFCGLATSSGDIPEKASDQHITDV